MGYSADLDGLHLQAEVLDDGWYYRISKSGKGTVKDWTPAPAPSASKYEELLCRFNKTYTD